MGLGRAGCGEATTPIRLTQLITTGTGFLVTLFCMHSFEVIPSNVRPTWLIRLKKIFCWPIVRNATFEVWQKKVSKDMNYLYFQLPYQVQSPAEASLPYKAVDLTPNLQLMPRSRLRLKLRLRPSLRRKPRLRQRPILRRRQILRQRPRLRPFWGAEIWIASYSDRALYIKEKGVENTRPGRIF